MKKVFVEKFIEELHNATGSFDVVDTDRSFTRHCHFIKDNMGQATYVYAIKDIYGEEDYYYNLGLFFLTITSL